MPFFFFFFRLTRVGEGRGHGGVLVGERRVCHEPVDQVPGRGGQGHHAGGRGGGLRRGERAERQDRKVRRDSPPAPGHDRECFLIFLFFVLVCVFGFFCIAYFDVLQRDFR